MLDAFVERWLGPLLTVVGGAGLLLLFAISIGWLSRDRHPWLPQGAQHGMRPAQLRDDVELWLWLCLLLVTIGLTLMRHFSRERRAARSDG